MLMIITDCSKGPVCEEQVDKFLNNFCVSARQVQGSQSIQLVTGATCAPKVCNEIVYIAL